MIWDSYFIFKKNEHLILPGTILYQRVPLRLFVFRKGWKSLWGRDST
jgi:hypothetical protein